MYLEYIFVVISRFVQTNITTTRLLWGTLNIYGALSMDKGKSGYIHISVVGKVNSL